jgi:selenocysteine-specific elongation factor
VREQHQRYPLRSGLSKEEWRTRLGLSPKVATEIFAILQAEGRLETVGSSENKEVPQRGSLICLSGFAPSFTLDQQRQVERLLQRFWAQPYTPPDRIEAEELVGAEVMSALIEQGRFIKLGGGILFLRETYDEAIAKLVEHLRHHHKMTASEARDVLGTTRKYILPLLEYMDALHITRRIGDERVLGATPLHS